MARRPSSHAPFPPPPPPQASYHRKLSTHMGAIDDHFSFDHDIATSAPISPIDWSKAVGFSSSSEGSEGVFFVQFQDDSAVVVKGSSTVAADMFAQTLAHFANIPIPSFRVLRYDVDAEYDTVCRTLDMLDLENPPGVRGKHNKTLDRPVIMIMEYVRGKSLRDLPLDQIFGQSFALSTKGKEVLQEMGRFVCLDVLINNWDRLPLIWDHDGNSENVLFITDQRRHLHPIAIDNSITCIDPAALPENFSEYLHKVRRIFNEIATIYCFPKQPYFENVLDSFPITSPKLSPSLENVRSFFEKNVGYDIRTAGLKEFILGFMQTVESFACLTLSDLENFKHDIEGEIQDCMDRCKMGLETIGMGKVNLDFLDAVLKIYREALPLAQLVLGNGGASKP